MHSSTKVGLNLAVNTNRETIFLTEPKYSVAF